MKVFRFIAETANEAVEQIRSQLGHDAVVLHVRRLPGEGISRLWSRPKIEVLAAAKPEEKQRTPLSAPSNAPVAAAIPQGGTLDLVAGDEPGETASRSADEALQGIDSNRARLLTGADMAAFQAAAGQQAPVQLNHKRTERWQLESLLVEMGVMPRFTHQVIDRLEARHGHLPPSSLREELNRAGSVLADFWDQSPRRHGGAHLHAFIGPAGSGKTTALCKWLTQSTLLDGRSTHVWRLDGATANTAESLSVYGEILGVPVSRAVDPEVAASVEIGFIDLPGIDWKDAGAIRDLGEQLLDLPPAQIHLVLNGAYESQLLLAQARAFAGLPVADLILTHLDEETRWGKVWNLVLGTKFRVGWLSAGQNIPGVFRPADASEFIARQCA